MNTREEQRKERIEKTKELIKDKGTFSYEKLIAMLMFKYYLTKRTAQEHIDCLIRIGYCSKTGDIIKYNEGLTQYG